MISGSTSVTDTFMPFMQAPAYMTKAKASGVKAVAGETGILKNRAVCP